MAAPETFMAGLVFHFYFHSPRTSAHFWEFAPTVRSALWTLKDPLQMWALGFGLVSIFGLVLLSVLFPLCTSPRGHATSSDLGQCLSLEDPRPPRKWSSYSYCPHSWSPLRPDFPCPLDLGDPSLPEEFRFPPHAMPAPGPQPDLIIFPLLVTAVCWSWPGSSHTAPVTDKPSWPDTQGPQRITDVIWRTSGAFLSIDFYMINVN